MNADLEPILRTIREVEVSPAADLRHFDSVQILTKPQATTQRAQVP